mgnify:CR=1 FL=1
MMRLFLRKKHALLCQISRFSSGTRHAPLPGKALASRKAPKRTGIALVCL